MLSKSAEARDGDSAEMGSSTAEQRGTTAPEGCGGETTGQVGAWTDQVLTWQWLLPVHLLEASPLPPRSMLFGDHWDSCATRSGGEEWGENSDTFKNWLLLEAQGKCW